MPYGVQVILTVDGLQFLCWRITKITTWSCTKTCHITHYYSNTFYNKLLTTFHVFKDGIKRFSRKHWSNVLMTTDRRAFKLIASSTVIFSSPFLEFYYVCRQPLSGNTHIFTCLFPRFMERRNSYRTEHFTSDPSLQWCHIFMSHYLRVTNMHRHNGVTFRRNKQTQFGSEGRGAWKAVTYLFTT